MNAITTTDGQKKQYRRLVEDTAERVLTEGGLLDKDRMQRLLESGDEFRTGMMELIEQLTDSDQFADEEVESTYGYLSGYSQPKSLAEQATLLKGLFPELAQATFDTATPGEALPSNAEGRFLIPNWRLLGKTYSEAVQNVLNKIKEVRGSFYNYCDGQIDETHLRQNAKKEEVFRQLAEAQSGHDLLVIAAQFGLRHRGKSVRRARVVMFGGECGLGAFEIGIMLLTHPERLENLDDLWIDCPGDEFSPDGDGDFSESPYFEFLGVQVRFAAYAVDNAHDRYGSASAFLPSLPQ